MVQVIEQQGGIWGQLGKGFGQGLAEQIPKEIDQYKLSQGLKKIGEQEGLTPFQQFANLASIPGATPQMIQSGADLLRTQGIRNAYQRMAGASPEETQVVQPQDKFQNVPFAGIKPGQSQSKAAVQPEYGQPQISESNPLRTEAIPKKPWNSQRLNQEISNNFQKYPGITQPEALQMAREAEQRELAQPVAEQAIDAYKEGVQNKARERFNEVLEKKLQKSGDQTYKDAIGESQAALERGMERDLRLNPNASIEDVVDRWTTKALDLAKAKSQLNEFVNRDFEQKYNPSKKSDNFNKLKAYSKIFSQTGNQEEYYNLLRSKEGLSPKGAAYFAYERSAPVKDFVKNIKPTQFEDFNAASRRYANQIKDLVNSDDSFLAIAQDISDRSPYFNVSAFFEELGHNMELFSPRMQREIAEGPSNVLPSWGDILIFPIFWGKR